MESIESCLMSLFVVSLYLMNVIHIKHEQDGHNIFGKLSSEEYKQVLGNIKHCILATDLALFFTNKSRIEQLFDKDTFSWGLSDHRSV